MEAPNLSQSQRYRAQLEEALKESNKVNAQLSRTIWLLVSRQPGRTITLDEVDLHPLYELDYQRPAGEKSSVLQITAKQMMEPTAEQLTLLADALRGTSNHPQEAMTAVGLSDHPVHYIMRVLAPQLVLRAGTWSNPEPEQP